MPLPGPIGLPCALNYTLNSASMCTFDASKLDSTNLQCPQSSILTGNSCISLCSASFVPNATLGCVTDPKLLNNYTVPAETTSCPTGQTLKRTGAAKGGLKFCVPSSYKPNESVPFCPTGYIQSGNRRYKPCPSNSDPGSTPPLCYASYGTQYNPIPSSSPSPNPVSSSTVPLPNITVTVSPPTATNTTSTNTLNSSDYVNNDTLIVNNTEVVDDNQTLMSNIMVYKYQIMIAFIVIFIIIGAIALYK